jgi:hypothetical protein
MMYPLAIPASFHYGDIWLILAFCKLAFLKSIFYYLSVLMRPRFVSCMAILPCVVYVDSPRADKIRRKLLYQGSLFVFSPRASTVALCQHADQLIREAFGKLSPRKAQYSLPVEEYAAILGKLKPKFIHHPKSKECIQAILKEMGCDPEKTYFDVPRMRSSTSDNYLTTGIAYAWHPHRDTWYSAPQCQLNWWIPIYDIDAGDGLAFHSRYWDTPVVNDSNIYNYYEWNKTHRAAAAQHVKQDPRPLPRPVEPVELEPQVRPVCPVGGIILFSGAQLHSTVPNTSGETRYSIDFRTVDVDDVAAKRGAPNIDSACTGTSLRDFLRATDFSRVPEEVVSLYNDGTEGIGDLVYRPNDPNVSSH